MEISMSISEFKVLVGITTTIIVGLWTYYLFIAERTHSPKVEMSFNTECFDFNDKFYLVTTKLVIKNTSKVLLDPTSAQIKMQQILPNTKAFGDLSFDDFNILKEGDENLLFPMLAQRDWEKENAPIILEPGESEELTADFFLSKSTELIRMYGAIQNPVTNLSWVKIDNLEINNICKSNEASRDE